MDHVEMKAAYEKAIMDDIVTRLREKHNEFRAIVGVNQTVIIDTIYAEAAVEIERLRNQIRSLEAERNYWQRCAVNND